MWGKKELNNRVKEALEVEGHERNEYQRDGRGAEQ